jgi:uncharacterized membrane protein required for colicin V production
MLLDLVVILFLCLGLIVGWQQGLFKFVRKILPFFGALVIAGFLCNLVADKLLEIPQVNEALNNWVGSFFDKFGEVLTSPFVKEGDHLFLQGAEGNIPLVDILKDKFGFLGGTIEAILMNFNELEGQSIAGAVIPGIVTIISYVVSYAALFLGLIIAIAIATKIIAKLMKKKFFKYIDRFFGAIVWEALVIVVIYILLSVLMLFENESAIQPFMEYLKGDSHVVRIMYDNNIFLILLNEVGKSFDLIK